MIDIAALRKAHRISQQSLAEKLSVKQSFLSAIENGRSRLPADKRERLTEIFGEEEIRKFSSCDHHDHPAAPDNDSEISESEMMARLLRIFHSQEHKDDDHNHRLHHQRIDEMQQRIDRLLERNDKISEKNISLQSRLDQSTARIIEARNEIHRLREILIRHGIDPDN